jgi:hypothetical protein
MLSRLFWDMNIGEKDVERLFEEKIDTVDEPESQRFLVRLLMSCDWYTLLKLLPPKKLAIVLNDEILNKVFPKELRDRYVYARDVLSRKIISFSG